MAAPPDSAQSRKRVQTYGKSYKRLPDLKQASPQKPTSHTGGISSREASSIDNTSRPSPEQSPPSTAQSRVPTPKRPRTGDVFDVPSSDEENISAPSRLKPPIIQSRVPTPKRPRSADVFDVPSSDEEDMPSRTPNIRIKETQNARGGASMVTKSEGQRRTNPKVDAKRRKIVPDVTTTNTKEIRQSPKKTLISKPTLLEKNRDKPLSLEKNTKPLQSASQINRTVPELKPSSSLQPSLNPAVHAIPVRKRIASPVKKQTGGLSAQPQRLKPLAKPSFGPAKERKAAVSQPANTGPSMLESPSSQEGIRPKAPILKLPSSQEGIRPKAPVSKLLSSQEGIRPKASISKLPPSQEGMRPKPRKAASPAKIQKSSILHHNTAPVSKAAKELLKPESSIYDMDESSADEATERNRPVPIVKKKRPPTLPYKAPSMPAIETLPTKVEMRAWDMEESSADETMQFPTPPRKQNFTIPTNQHETPFSSAPAHPKQAGSRRRLIDNFAESFGESFDASSSSEAESEDESIHTPLASQAESQQPTVYQDHSFEERKSVERVEPTNAGVGEPSGSQGRRPRMTYGSSRSMLADQNLDFNTPMFTDLEMDDATKRRARRAIVVPLKPLPGRNDDSDDMEDSQSKTDIRSLHELKQAGAKNRVVTNVEHLLADIGAPGKVSVSQRRSGLLDLSTRLLDKEFRREFLENGLETGLFVHLGKEEDIVAGFLLISSLLVCIHDSFRPHTVQQLRQQGITRLFIRQVEKTSSVQTIAKERSSNMSKIAQQLLAEYQTSLLQADIWEDTKPQIITPHGVALRCLELMVRKTREAGISTDVMSKELSTKLFSILQYYKGDVADNSNKDMQFVEFQLALSILHSHSVRAMTNRDEEIWVTEYLPIISNVLLRVLANPQTEFGATQVLALGLTINVTNENPKACNCLANKELLGVIATAVIKRFDVLSGFMLEEDRLRTVEHVIMALGVLINSAEWSEASRGYLQSFKDIPSDPLSELIRIFQQNQAKTAEANSIEESHQNVAFGYLAVLLGYLSISPPILKRVQQAQPNKTLRPLLASIEEFISYWKQVDEMARGDGDDGQEPTQGLVPRLQRMVDQLREMSGSPLRI